VSTLADWVGAAAATLMPLVEVIGGHVFAAERIHTDDTTVPVLAKGKTRTGRLWTDVRDDRPFAGPDPPAAVFFYSRDRGGEHPEQHLAGFAGLMQANAYAGFNRLYEATRKPGTIIEAACWAHGRRKFFDLAQINKAPIAIEAVERIDTLFAIEREINGRTPQDRVRVRHERSRPLVIDWTAGCASSAPESPRTARPARPSTTASSAGPRSGASSTTAACACRITPPSASCVPSRSGVATGPSPAPMKAAAKLNNVDPQAWLADILARLPDHPARRINQLLPWHWRKQDAMLAA
jgi:transposase